MLDIVIEARKASLGPGMDVKRILPYRLHRMIGPFIFMDHAGPVTIDPALTSSIDVLPHPHIGLFTVSYLFGGKVTHRDSLGVEQVIRPGEVNWMTAGKGIAHSERFEDLPFWRVASSNSSKPGLPFPKNMKKQNLDNYQPDELPIFTDTGVWMRLIAGNAYGLSNHVKTHSPLFYIHVRLQKDAHFGLPHEHPERGVYRQR